MRNKFLFLTKYSLNKKIKTKWFVIANVLMFLSVLTLANLTTIITFFGGDFENDTNIVLVKNDYFSKEELEEVLIANNKMFNLDNSYKIEEANEVNDKLTEEDDEVYIEVLNDNSNYFKVNLISYNKIGMIEEQLYNASLNQLKYNYALVNSNLDLEELAKLETPILIEKNVVNTKSSDDSSELFEVILPILIMPLFILTIFVVQMIGAEINEEKSSRSMEIIISNVSANVHFGSKILAANLFAIIQGSLLFIYGLISMFVSKLISNKSILDDIRPIIGDFRLPNNIVLIILLIIFMSLLSLISYSLISGILASMTTNMEDYQQVQSPIMIIMLVGYYLSIFSFLFEGSLFIRVLSYVPLLSSLLSPVLFFLNQITIIDVLISNVLLIVFNYLLVKYGLRIYKVGILNYSTDKIWRRMFKAVKE